MCDHFSATGGSSGICELVAGQIRPDYWCDLFLVDQDVPVPVELHRTFQVRKTDDPRQLIFGWASVAVDKQGRVVTDSQGDTIAPDVLEDAAYQFVLNFREGDEMHTDEVAAQLVESFVVTEDKLAVLAKGADGTVDEETLATLKKVLPIGWWTGFHIPDRAIYERARKSYPMFSIGGIAIREEVEE